MNSGFATPRLDQYFEGATRLRHKVYNFTVRREDSVDFMSYLIIHTMPPGDHECMDEYEFLFFRTFKHLVMDVCELDEWPIAIMIQK